MKYKEFEKLMKDVGFDVINGRDNIKLFNENLLVATISKERTKTLNTNCVDIMWLSEELRDYVAKRCVELAFTELEDRKDEEKYYLRQKGVGSWSFLNFNIDTQGYIVAGKKVNYTYKTQFTQSEIDDMPECYTHPAVWEKIKVERED